MNTIYLKEVICTTPIAIRQSINEMMKCIQSWNQLNEDEYYEFRLVLNELISNSVFHGHKGLCNKKVVVSIKKINNFTLKICIRDEGKGFNYKKICTDQCLCDSNILNEGGRGLMLVQAMCDKVQFNKNGNEINIVKSITRRTGTNPV